MWLIFEVPLAFGVFCSIIAISMAIVDGFEWAFVNHPWYLFAGFIAFLGTLYAIHPPPTAADRAAWTEYMQTYGLGLTFNNYKFDD